MAIATLCLFRHLTTITERPFRALTSQKSLRDNYCSASVPWGLFYLLLILVSVYCRDADPACLRHAPQIFFINYT